jgi:hypothetical protein
MMILMDINKQKKEIQSLAIKYVNDGHDVCIITKRYANTEESSKVFRLARELGINKVYFTNREMKFEHIINLRIEKHFENSKYEVDLINHVCKEREYDCLVIPVEEEYWRDLVY